MLGPLAEELGVSERMSFIQAAAEDLSPIPDATVDVVTTRSVLIYVDDKAKAFKEFHRVLRPAGRVSIFEPINNCFPDSTPAFRSKTLTPPTPETAIEPRSSFGPGPGSGDQHTTSDGCLGAVNLLPPPKSCIIDSQVAAVDRVVAVRADRDHQIRVVRLVDVPFDDVVDVDLVGTAAGIGTRPMSLVKQRSFDGDGNGSSMLSHGPGLWAWPTQRIGGSRLRGE